MRCPRAAGWLRSYAAREIRWFDDCPADGQPTIFSPKREHMSTQPFRRSYLSNELRISTKSFQGLQHSAPNVTHRRSTEDNGTGSFDFTTTGYVVGIKFSSATCRIYTSYNDSLDDRGEDDSSSSLTNSGSDIRRSRGNCTNGYEI